MTNYPYFTYQLMPGYYLTKTITFIPFDAEPVKRGISVCWRGDVFDAEGLILPAARKALQEIGWAEQRSTHMSVCVIYGPKDCDYIGPDGVPHWSNDPPRLTVNLFKPKTDGGVDKSIIIKHPLTIGVDKRVALQKQRKEEEN